MTEKPVQPQDKYVLRMPDGMRERIKSMAEKSGRSMNAEIIHRLANSLDFPRFDDFALGLDEDLDFDLMVEAGRNQRSLKEELVYRLRKSLAPEPSLLKELQDRAWEARRKYDDILRLFIQLTPEERRILEERLEIVEKSYPPKITSKQLGRFIEMNPIGKKGHMVLTVPTSDYTAISSPENVSD